MVKIDKAMIEAIKQEERQRQLKLAEILSKEANRALQDLQRRLKRG